jgi:hypothetical protein
MRFPAPFPVRRILSPLALLVAASGAHAQQDEPDSAPEQATETAAAEQQASETAAAEQQAPEGQQFGKWFRQAAEAYAEEDHGRWVEALQELHRLRPFNQDFMRQLVMGYALTGQTSRAFNMMLRMQQQGLAEDWDAIDEVESMRQYPLYEYLRDLMQEAGKPSGEVETVASLSRDYPMPEAVAHDGDSGRVFVGTVRDGVILAGRPQDDRLEVFADPDGVPGLMAVFGLLVDEQRGHLWVATGGVRQFRGFTPGSAGRSALLKLDLETGEKLGEYRVLPDGTPHLLGALAQTEDGTLYAADGAAPVVFRLRPGEERPTPFAGSRRFTSLRGIALSADESKLYLSDYELGLFFLDLEQGGRGFALGIPETLNASGIDGLYQWNGHLVAVQNNVSPQRVLRLELDDSGTRVANIATVAKALPQFDTPTFGAVAGDDLLFLGASHWQYVRPDGQPADPPLPEVPLLRAAVDEARSVVMGERILEQLRGQQNQGPLKAPDSN